MNRYAPWKCTAVVKERAALEKARDARMGNLANPEVNARFDAALQTLTEAIAAHVDATGCDDNH